MGKSLLHLVRYFLGLDSPQSQTTPAERDALARHAASRRLLAEIGVFEGRCSALFVRAMAADGLFYAIDPFFPGRLGICWGKFIAHREIRRAAAGRRIVFVEKVSFAAAADVAGMLDFLFIDGDHSLEGITRDWADWAGRIQPGGILALHDTRVPAHNPRVAELGSHQYFESHIRHDARFELVEQVDSLSILRRRTDP